MKVNIHWFLSLLIFLFTLYSCNESINANKELKYLKSEKGVQYYKGTPFTGELLSYYDNGGIKYSGIYKDGLQEGTHKFYSEDGLLIDEPTFKGGNRIKSEILKFNTQTKILYKKVIEKLKLIELSQKKFYEHSGTYARNKGTLINFIETDSIALTKRRDLSIIDKELTRLYGEDTTRDIVIIDTLGYQKVSEIFKNFNFRRMFIIDDSQTNEINMESSLYEHNDGRLIPTFKASISKKDVLEGQGLSPSLIISEIYTEVEKGNNESKINGEYISLIKIADRPSVINWPLTFEDNEQVQLIDRELMSVEQTEINTTIESDAAITSSENKPSEIVKAVEQSKDINLAIITDPNGTTNVRLGKGTNSSVIYELKTNEVFDVYPNSDKWWLVELRNKQKGYIFYDRVSLIRNGLDGKYTDVSNYFFNEDDLESISSDELKIMRNEIFARYGYIFKEGGEMNNYFKNEKWYKPKLNNVDSKLTQLEKYNIQLIRKYETENAN